MRILFLHLILFFFNISSSFTFILLDFLKSSFVFCFLFLSHVLEFQQFHCKENKGIIMLMSWNKNHN